MTSTHFVNAASLTWDGGDANGANGAGGGSGTWNTSTPNWYDGSIDILWPNTTADSAIFAGTAGTVTVSGTITLNATDFQTSGYLLTGGTLQFGGTSPTITLATGLLAEIASNISNSGGSAIPAINAGSGSTLTLSGLVGGSNGASLTLAGPGTVILSGSADNGFLGATINAGVLELAKASSGTIHAIGGNVAINNGGTLRLGGTGNDQIFFQNNVTMVAGAIFDLNGKSEGFNGLTGAGGTVTNGSASTTSTISVGQNGATATFDGTIQNGAGTTAFTKDGSGTQTLTGTNTYTGVTTLNGGKLSVSTLANGGVASNIGASTSAASNLVIGNGVLQYTGGSVTIDRNFSGNSGATGGVEVTQAGTTLTLTGGATSASFTKTGAGALEISGVLANLTATVNGGTLTMSGTGDNSSASAVVTSGTLVLAKASNGSVHAIGSALTINGGTVQFAGSGNDQLFDRVDVTMASGGTLDLNGKSETFDQFSGVAGAVVTNTAASTTGTINVGNFNSSATFAGTIQDGAGVVAVTKSASTTQTLSGSNTYTGATTITGGTLSVSTLANGGVASNIGASTNAASSLVIGNGVLQYTGGSVTIDRSFSGGGSGGFEVTEASTTLTLTGGASGASFTKTGAGALTISGVLANLTATVNGGTLTMSGTGDNSGASATVSAGTLTLAKASTGSVHALGGSVTVSGGTLQLAGTGNDQIYDNTNVTVNSGTFDLNGRSDKIRGLLGSGGLVTNTAASTTGTLQLGGFSGASTYAGNIQDGAGSVALTIGPDVNVLVTLSGNNTYSGATTLGGTGTVLTAGSTTAFSANSAYTLTNSTGQALNLNGFNNTIGSLAGGGASGGNVTLGSATLTVGANNLGASFAGAISGTGGLTKTGNNSQALTGTNNYTGPTRVTGGTLEVIGSLSGTLGAGATPGVQIDNTGTLLLSGAAGEQINNAATVKFNGGTLGFNNAANQIETLGTLTLSANSKLDFGASGGNDKFLFAAGVTHTAGVGTLTIDNWIGNQAGGVDSTNDRLVFFGDVAAADSFANVFNQADVSFTNYGTGYAAIAFGTTSYEIVPVPEPSSTALIGAAALLGLVGFRESRRRLRWPRPAQRCDGSAQ